MASLSTGLGRLVAPYVAKSLLGPLARHGPAAKPLMIAAIASARAVDVISHSCTSAFSTAARINRGVAPRSRACLT